jgi:hypothetical protein
MGIIIFWIFCAIVAGAIGAMKNRTAEGVLWGSLLGIIGVIVILCKSKKTENS